MAGASFKVNADSLKELISKIDNASVKEEVSRLIQKKAVAALVAAAIADNFNKEGPGWAPLKPSTIRASVSAKLKKKLDQMSDSELKSHEKKSKEPFRKILRRTGLLFNTVTTPGYRGSQKGVSGQNVYRIEDDKLIWGTDLAYAGLHNNGDARRHIPKREFLVIRKEWQKKLQEYLVGGAREIIKTKLGDGS